MLLCLTAPVLVAAVNSTFLSSSEACAPQRSRWRAWLRCLTISRAGIATLIVVLTAATAATISYRITARKVIWGCLIAVAVSAVAMKSLKTVMSRFDETNLRAEYQTRHEMGRGYYLRLAALILEDNWLGSRFKQLVVLG